MALLDALDAIARFESGRLPYVGFSGVDLTGRPLDQYGFPVWSGINTSFGITHAAGLYQFEPATWRGYAMMLGAWNFSVATQKAIAALCFSREGFQPWAPYDKKLSAFIMANGGPSAFGLVASATSLMAQTSPKLPVPSGDTPQLGINDTVLFANTDKIGPFQFILRRAKR